MTIYTGTSGTDNFVGGAGVADRFDFTPANLSASDSVSGGSGEVIDVLRFIAAGNISAAQLAGVSGIEQVEMFAGSSIALTAAMLASANHGLVTVVGTNGNDTVHCEAVTDAGRRIMFTAEQGDDLFVGGSGDDTVTIKASDLNSIDSLSGGTAGQDTLVIASLGTLATNAVQQVTGFETIALHEKGNTLTLLQPFVTSAANGAVSVVGNKGNDWLDAHSIRAGKITFEGRAGGDHFSGGDDKDRAYGGKNLDVLFGGRGDDKLYGGDSNDNLYGGLGNDLINGGVANVGGFPIPSTLDGGAGMDTIIAGSGYNAIFGGAESDVITIHSGDAAFDSVVFNEESDGGAAGDLVKGDAGHLDEGDVLLIFKNNGDRFATLGSYDTELFDDGTAPGGNGGPMDGADAIFYDGNLTGLHLGSAGEVDQYFVDHYYAAMDVGAFLAEKSADGSVTIYYDADAYNLGGVLTMAHIDHYTGSIEGLMLYFDVRASEES